MDFSQYPVWEAVVHLAGLSALLLFANVLRRKIPFLRKSLLPTAVIAGFIGLILKETLFAYVVSAGDYERTLFILRTITYHTIALGFIALGLKVRSLVHVEGGTKRGFYSGLLIVSTYLIQGLVALSLSFILVRTVFPNFFEAAGMLFPMGFGQGPGQAQNIGNLYEVTHGFVGGTTFGVAIASFGFVWASIAGVIYLNLLNKRGAIDYARKKTASAVKAEDIESSDEIPIAEAIDKFTIQIALVLVVYLFTFGFIFGINQWMQTGVLGNFGIETVGPLIVGFNFIVGMLFALVAKRLFLFLRAKRIMTRQYPNNYMLDRIAGSIFDFMVIAAIAAIRIEDLRNLWGPFIILSFIVGTVTLFYVKAMCKRIYPDYTNAATMGMFGMLTGTASTGIILLREVDPSFKTPAANDLVIGSSTAILFGFPILLLVGVAPLGGLQFFLAWIAVVTLFTVFFTLLIKLNPKRT